MYKYSSILWAPLHQLLLSHHDDKSNIVISSPCCSSYWSTAIWRGQYLFIPKILKPMRPRHIINVFSGRGKTVGSVEFRTIDWTLQQSHWCSTRYTGADCQNHGVGGIYCGKLLFCVILGMNICVLWQNFVHYFVKITLEK